MLPFLLGTNPSRNAIKVGQSLAHSLMNVLLNPGLVGLKHLATARTGAGRSRSLSRLGSRRVDEMPGLEMSFVSVSS